jgi:hypothetical protein
MVSLPPNPSTLRVRAWRRLRTLGAVALKRSVYLLPDLPEHYEHFQWLAQEIQREGGEATLVRVEQIENMTPAAVIRLFHEARDREYRRLAARYRKLLQALDRKSAAGREQRQEEFARLTKDHQRIRDVDFFDAPGRAEVERLEEALGMRVHPPEQAAREGRRPLDASQLRGRRWATRPRPHVDRIASAWLIKRFIDPDATFVFANPSQFPPDAIPFDSPGAELGHHGEDCTFETLLKGARLRDRRLTRLAEIVHEADLGDGKFERDEARGIDVAVQGLLAASPDDQQVLAHGLTLFDGLYATTRPRD